MSLNNWDSNVVPIRTQSKIDREAESDDIQNTTEVTNQQLETIVAGMQSLADQDAENFRRQVSKEMRAHIRSINT